MLDPTPDGFANAEGAAAGADVESLRDPGFGDVECLPLQCPNCGHLIRIIVFSQAAVQDDWPEVDRTAGAGDETWN